MFRAFSHPSSGARWLQWQPLVLPSYRGDSRAVFAVAPVASVWWFIWIVRWCTDLQTLNLKAIGTDFRGTSLSYQANDGADGPQRTPSARLPWYPAFISTVIICSLRRYSFLRKSQHNNNCQTELFSSDTTIPKFNFSVMTTLISVRPELQNRFSLTKH